MDRRTEEGKWLEEGPRPAVEPEQPTPTPGSAGSDGGGEMLDKKPNPAHHLTVAVGPIGVEGYCGCGERFKGYSEQAVERAHRDHVDEPRYACGCTTYPCDHTGCDCSEPLHNPGPGCPGQPGYFDTVQAKKPNIGPCVCPMQSLTPGYGHGKHCPLHAPAVEPEQPTYTVTHDTEDGYPAIVVNQTTNTMTRRMYLLGKADERARIRRIVEDHFHPYAVDHQLLAAIDGGDDE